MKNKKKILAKVKAAEQAYREKYGGKTVQPYFENGKFVNASVDGSWPVDIFMNGFYSGIDYANNKKRKS